ncbi:MAG: hypothetical protein ABFC77_07105 [Thermoguttaceae bacterium]
MRSRWTVRVAAVLTLVTLGIETAAAVDAKPQTPASTNDSSIFPGFRSGSRAVLASRQGVRDQVCYALADGQISPSERTAILTHAQSVLTHEEYASFKQKLDKIAPPLSPVEKQKIAARSMHRPRSSVAARAATPKVVSRSSSVPAQGSQVLVSERMASDHAAR